MKKILPKVLLVIFLLGLTYAAQALHQDPVATQYTFQNTTQKNRSHIRGNITLYRHTIESHAGSYFFQRFFLLKKNGVWIKVTKRKYKKILKSLVASHPQLQAKIGKRGYRYKAMAKIIKQYNDFNTIATIKRAKQIGK